jgi:tetratricopeptide (TPR) repeat protein
MAPAMLYLGLFFIFLSNVIRYFPLNIHESFAMVFSIVGIITTFAYLIMALTHKINYSCTNCGKIYSHEDIKKLAEQQNFKLSGTAKSAIKSFVIFMLISLAVAGFLYYSIINNSTIKSINRINQDIPKGNAHWDKAQLLFQEIKKEKDVEKIKKIDADIVVELNAVLEEQPNNPRVWSELGDAYSWVSYLGGDPEVRLAAYKKAESLDPTNFVYINGVGDQLISMGKYSEAILELQKATRLPLTSDYTYLSLAQAYRGAKIYDLARQNYELAIQKFSSHNTDGKYDIQVLQAQQEMAALPK